jgi:hypothetical protein
LPKGGNVPLFGKEGEGRFLNNDGLLMNSLITQKWKFAGQKTPISFPAIAGIRRINESWIPASAGMTEMCILCNLFVVYPVSDNRLLWEVIR